MDLAAIQIAVNEIAAAMVAKGLVKPEAQFHIESNVEPRVVMSWSKTAGRNDWDREYSIAGPGEPDAILAEARAFIAAMPDAEERRRSEFMVALGDVIDLGRKNGIEVDYVNPLVETMKRLSENALTHRAA